MVLPVLLGAGSLVLKTATGGTETLFPARDRRATVVFVVIAECPIARQYSPEMARLARAYDPKGVRFVMAFADADPPVVRTQMKAFGLPFPGAKADRRLISLLHVRAVPTAALIGTDGTIAYVGRVDDRYPSLGVQRSPRRHDLRLALDQYLEGKPVVPARTTVVGCALPSP